MLTVAVDNRVTRRRVLAAGGAGLGVTALTGLAGCGLFDDGPEPPPAPDPLRPLRDAALALAAAHERTARAVPRLRARLAPIAAAHREHAAELDRILRPAAPGAPAASAPAAAPAADEKTALAELRAAERRAQKDAAAACRQAPAERATLVGTIAAARACHAEVLR